MTNKWTDSDAKNAGFVFDNHNLGLTLPHVGLKAGGIGLVIFHQPKVNHDRWLSRKDTLALRDWLNEKLESEKAAQEVREDTLKPVDFSGSETVTTGTWEDLGISPYQLQLK